MGFSSELCSPQSHGAVQQMQEAELRLLEGMRKWMAQRVKSDREYAGLLHHMSLQDSGPQSGNSGPDSPISQVSFHELPSTHPHRLPLRGGVGDVANPGFRATVIFFLLPYPTIVLGRDNKPDGELEPGAAAACGRSELRALEQTERADPREAAPEKDLQRAVAAAAAGAHEGRCAPSGLCHNKAQFCTRVRREGEVTDRRPSSRMACVAQLQLPPFLSQLRLTCYRAC